MPTIGRKDGGRPLTKNQVQGLVKFFTDKYKKEIDEYNVGVAERNAAEDKRVGDINAKQSKALKSIKAALDDATEKYKALKEQLGPSVEKKLKADVKVFKDYKSGVVQPIIDNFQKLYESSGLPPEEFRKYQKEFLDSPEISAKIHELIKQNTPSERKAGVVRSDEQKALSKAEGKVESLEQAYRDNNSVVRPNYEERKGYDYNNEIGPVQLLQKINNYLKAFDAGRPLTMDEYIRSFPKEESEELPWTQRYVMDQLNKSSGKKSQEDFISYGSKMSDFLERARSEFRNARDEEYSREAKKLVKKGVKQNSPEFKNLVEKLDKKYGDENKVKSYAERLANMRSEKRDLANYGLSTNYFTDKAKQQLIDGLEEMGISGKTPTDLEISRLADKMFKEYKMLNEPIDVDGTGAKFFQPFNVGEARKKGDEYTYLPKYSEFILPKDVVIRKDKDGLVGLGTVGSNGEFTPVSDAVLSQLKRRDFNNSPDFGDAFVRKGRRVYRVRQGKNMANNPVARIYATALRKELQGLKPDVLEDIENKNPWMAYRGIDDATDRPLAEFSLTRPSLSDEAKQMLNTMSDDKLRKWMQDNPEKAHELFGKFENLDLEDPDTYKMLADSLSGIRLKPGSTVRANLNNQIRGSMGVYDMMKALNKYKGWTLGDIVAKMDPAVLFGLLDKVPEYSIRKSDNTLQVTNTIPEDDVMDFRELVPIANAARNAWLEKQAEKLQTADADALKRADTNTAKLQAGLNRSDVAYPDDWERDSYNTKGKLEVWHGMYDPKKHGEAAVKKYGDKPIRVMSRAYNPSVKDFPETRSYFTLTGEPIAANAWKTALMGVNKGDEKLKQFEMLELADELKRLAAESNATLADLRNGESLPEDFTPFTEADALAKVNEAIKGWEISGKKGPDDKPTKRPATIEDFLRVTDPIAYSDLVKERNSSNKYTAAADSTDKNTIFDEQKDLARQAMTHLFNDKRFKKQDTITKRATDIRNSIQDNADAAYKQEVARKEQEADAKARKGTQVKDIKDIKRKAGANVREYTVNPSQEQQDNYDLKSILNAFNEPGREFK